MKELINDLMTFSVWGQIALIMTTIGILLIIAWGMIVAIDYYQDEICAWLTRASEKLDYWGWLAKAQLDEQESDPDYHDISDWADWEKFKETELCMQRPSYHIGEILKGQVRL